MGKQAPKSEKDYTVQSFSSTGDVLWRRPHSGEAENTTTAAILFHTYLE